MQGKSTVNSFSGVEQGSISNSTGTSQQASWNNMLTSPEGLISNYNLSSGANAIDNDVRGFNGWNLGESSSQNRIIETGERMELSWSSSFSSHARSGRSLEGKQFEPSDFGLHVSEVTNGPLSFHSSGSNHTPMNVNLDTGYVCNGTDSGKGLQVGEQSNIYKLDGLETGQIPLRTDSVGTYSGSPSHIIEDNEGEQSSSSIWGSCKRKAFEGSSRHAYPGGSSSCFPQADNTLWHAVPDRYNTSGSLNISCPPLNTPIGSPPDHLGPMIGVGVSVLPSDACPSLGVARSVESSLRNLNRRGPSGYQRDFVPFNLSSTGSSRRSNAGTGHQSSRLFPVSDPFHIRSTSGESLSTPQMQSQSHVMHIPRLSRNIPPFPWNGSSSSRAGSSSNSRNNAEYPMYVSSHDTRNMAHDPTNWSLATGNLGNPSQISPGPITHTLPTPSWIPSRNSTPQSHQRLSEFSPWSLFPSVASESGDQSDFLPSLSSSPSVPSQETMLPSGSNSQGRPLYSRSSFVERQGDDVFGSSDLFRGLAADIEGRQRLISEIRQVLSAMRRGEHLRAEDYMLFDPFINHGMQILHDRHHDMRLDVDNMSYEELLALEERIGDVKTGLSEEMILKFLKQQKFTVRARTDLEPCCICQEEYAFGDNLGMLACGHDFHADCIKQWLVEKNLCPVCKTTALVTT